MVQITPYKDPNKEPDYQRSSQGISVPYSTSTIGTALTEGARLGSMAVQALDEHTKQTIDQQLFQDINAERTDSIHEGLRALEGETPVTRFDTVGGVNAAGERTNYAELPPGIAQADRRMETLANANLNRKLTDEAYYARMQETVQRVSTQYPGYARYAQDRGAHWLGTSTGANQQRAAIQQAIAQIGAGRDREADRDQRFLDSNMKYFLGPDNKFNSAMYNSAAGTIGSPAFARARAFIAEQQATEHAEDRADKELSWLEKNNRLTEGDVKAYAHGTANRIANKTFTDISFIVGGEERTYAQTLQLHKKIQTDPDATPEARAEIGKVLGMYQRRIENDIRLWAMNTNRQGRPVAAWLGEEGLNQLVKIYAEGLMGPIARDVGAGNLNGATRATELLRATKDNLAVSGLVQKDIREFSMMGALPAAALGAVITHRLTSGDPTGVGVQDRIVTGLRDIGMKRMLIGDGNTSYKSLSERYNLAFPTTTGIPLAPAQVRQQAEFIQKTVEDAKELLTSDHPNMTEQGRVGAALTISHPDNVKFIGDLNRDQQLRMYRNIATPAVTDAIFELGKNRPDLWNNYQTTAQQMFKRAYNTQLSNISQGAKDSFGNNIKFDEKTGRFSFENPRASQDVNRSRGSAALPVSATAQKAIDEVNASIQAYRYILEKNGQKLDDKELSLLGIVLKPQNPTSGSPNGSGRPSVKDKRSDLRDVESLGGEEAIPFSARATTGMNLGADALYTEATVARAMTPSTKELLKQQEERMERDSNVGGLREQMSPGGIPKALEREVAMDNFPGDMLNPRPGRPTDMGGGAPIPTKKSDRRDSTWGEIVSIPSNRGRGGLTTVLNPDPEKVAKLKTMLDNGDTYTKIAKEFNTTRGSVGGIIDRLGLGRGKPINPIRESEELANKVREMLGKGLSEAKIAKELNVKPSQVQHFRISEGIPSANPQGFQPGNVRGSGGSGTVEGRTPSTPTIPSQNRPMDQMTREEQNAARWLEQRYSAQNK